jgi:hypothetical protein
MITEWLKSILFRRQCCAELPVGKDCIAYCVKNRFHFGPHVTSAGKEFK